jgi:hypothetical protein
MGKGVSDSETTVRYPEYLEDAHKVHLEKVTTWVDSLVGVSPFTSYTSILSDVHDAFFGAGYIISDFPSLYDMYGKFMAGLDIEVLFDQIFTDSTQGTIIDNLVSVHAGILSDDVAQEAYPRFNTGLRDINSVMSSTFAVGRAMIEAQRVKEVSRFDAETRYRMIPVAVTRWQTHLQWNRDVINTYLKMLEGWVKVRSDLISQDFEMAEKDSMWPLRVLKHEGAAIGILTGATSTEEETPLWRHILSGVLGVASIFAL